MGWMWPANGRQMHRFHRGLSLQRWQLVTWLPCFGHWFRYKISQAVRRGWMTLIRLRELQVLLFGRTVATENRLFWSSSALPCDLSSEFKPSRVWRDAKSESWTNHRRNLHGPARPRNLSDIGVGPALEAQKWSNEDASFDLDLFSSLYYSETGSQLWTFAELGRRNVPTESRRGLVISWRLNEIILFQGPRQH